ncbi:MAG: heavy-metal-associated domain-containing protein [Pseudomonadota bacterium]
MNKIKVLIIGIVGMVLVLTVVPATSQTDQRKPINRAVIKVDSLSCGGCFSTISAGLVTLEGYSGMGVNLFRKLIAVDFIAPLTKEDISKKLSEVGYPGQVKYVDAISEKESFAYLDSREAGLRSSSGGGCCSVSEAPANNTSKDSKPQSVPSGGSCCSNPGANSTIPGQTL